MADAFFGGWQFNATQTFQSGIPFDVTYAGASADRDVGPNRPNVSGDITINGGRDDVLRYDAHRRSEQPVHATRAGHVRQYGTQLAERARVSPDRRVHLQAA